MIRFLQRRCILLNLAILLSGALTLQAQVGEDANRRIVMIPSRESGSGLVIGFDDQFVWVVSAKHVVEESASLTVQLYKAGKRNEGPGGDQIDCDRIKVPDGVIDLALLKCTISPTTEWSKPGRADLLSPLKSVPRSSRVTFSGNLQNGWFTPPSWGLVSKVTNTEILAANTFGIDVTGASGGPLLSEGGEILGIISEYQKEFSNISTIPWSVVKAWIKKSGVTPSHPLRNTSREPLGNGETEVSVSYQSIQVPDFGSLPSPLLRVSRRLPRLGQSSVEFDISGAGDPNLAPSQIRALRLTIPVVGFQYQIGQNVSLLRRKSFLGGIYIGSGLGYIFQDSKSIATGLLEEENVRSFTGVFEAGARYRLPGRSLGFQGNYREFVLTEQGPGVRYPRFRTYGFGLFVVLR